MAICDPLYLKYHSKGCRKDYSFSKRNNICDYNVGAHAINERSKSGIPSLLLVLQAVLLN